MVFICANFHEGDLVPLLDVVADLLERLLDRLGEDLSAVLCGTDEVVQEAGNIVLFVDEFAHIFILASVSDGNAAKLRGIGPGGNKNRKSDFVCILQLRFFPNSDCPDTFYDSISPALVSKSCRKF